MISDCNDQPRDLQLPLLSKWGTIMSIHVQAEHGGASSVALSASAREIPVNQCRYDGVLIDIAGVIHLDGQPIDGSIEAIERLRHAGVPFRLITNTTSKSSDKVYAVLNQLGVTVDASHVLTAPLATIGYLQRHRLRPHLLIADALSDDFDHCGLSTDDPNCVVLGDAGDKFDYARLNAAFRLLQSDSRAPLIAMGGNRYFRSADGQLSLDIYPFAALLSEASGREIVVTGKPAPAFFDSALASLDVSGGRVVMIGDDLESDVGGAIAAGVDGILVKTGKYDSDQLQQSDIHPTKVRENLADAIDHLLA